MLQRSFIYGDERYPYCLISSASLAGKIVIHVHPNGLVRVSAPDSATTAGIERALLKRARWIKNRVDLARRNNSFALPREYISGETHFYLGRRYRLKVEKKQKGRGEVRLSGGVICVKTPSMSSTKVRDLLDSWYRERATDYFCRRLSELSERMPWLKTPPTYRLAKMRRQWGSCSPRGKISLSPALIRAPRECIEYVIVHELCHVKEHNHSPRFYRLLARQLPGWQARKEKLDGLAELILSDR